MTNNSRLEIRENEINEEIKQLNKKVSMFTNVSWGFVIIGFIILFIGCGLLAYGQFKGFHEFGDFIGGSVGSIWSLAGLFFVYVAFLGQKQSILNQQIEILYNQEELRATRKELAGQKEQMELQNATLKQQQFENTFFNLLNYHEELISKLYWSNHNGRITLEQAYGQFRMNYEKKSGVEEQSKALVKSIIFNNTTSAFKDVLSPFFKSLHQLLLFVDTKCEKDKTYYIQLIESTLSDRNKVLLAYYCINDSFQLKSIINKYNLLDNLIEEELIHDNDYQILIDNQIIKNPL